MLTGLCWFHSERALFCFSLCLFARLKERLMSSRFPMMLWGSRVRGNCCMFRLNFGSVSLCCSCRFVSSGENTDQDLSCVCPVMSSFFPRRNFSCFWRCALNSVFQAFQIPKTEFLGAKLKNHKDQIQSKPGCVGALREKDSGNILKTVRFQVNSGSRMKRFSVGPDRFLRWICVLRGKHWHQDPNCDFSLSFQCPVMLWIHFSSLVWGDNPEYLENRKMYKINK